MFLTLISLGSVYSASFMKLNDVANYDSYIQNDGQGNIKFYFVDTSTININYPIITTGNNAGGFINVNIIDANTLLPITHNENITLLNSDLPTTMEFVFNNTINHNNLDSNLATGDYYIEVSLYGETAPDQQISITDFTPFHYNYVTPPPVVKKIISIVMIDAGGGIAGFLNGIYDPVIAFVVVFFVITFMMGVAVAIGVAIKRRLK